MQQLADLEAELLEEIAECTLGPLAYAPPFFRRFDCSLQLRNAAAMLFQLLPKLDCCLFSLVRRHPGSP